MAEFVIYLSQKSTILTFWGHITFLGQFLNSKVGTGTSWRLTMSPPSPWAFSGWYFLSQKGNPECPKKVGLFIHFWDMAVFERLRIFWNRPTIKQTFIPHSAPYKQLWRKSLEPFFQYGRISDIFVPKKYDFDFFGTYRGLIIVGTPKHYWNGPTISPTNCSASGHTWASSEVFVPRCFPAKHVFGCFWTFLGHLRVTFLWGTFRKIPTINLFIGWSSWLR